MEPTFPNAPLLGGAGGLLFAVHFTVWMVCATYGRQTRAEANLGAHFAASLLGFIVLASVGIYGWMLNPISPTSRTRGVSVAGSAATNLMVAFQIYEIIMAIVVPRLRGKHFEMVAHHIATLGLAVLGGYYQYVDYYAIFFFGLTEISSVPLAVVDLMKQYRGLPAKFPKINELSRVIFAVLFLSFRVVYWPIVSLRFWADSLTELKSPVIPQFVIVIFCVANVLLSSLQMYWGSLIISALAKMVKGDAADKDA